MNRQQLRRVVRIKDADEPHPFLFPGGDLLLGGFGEGVGVVVVLHEAQLPGSAVAENQER